MLWAPRILYSLTSFRVGLLLTVCPFYLRLVFVSYSKFACSSLLTVEICFGLSCLRVENRFGLFYLRFPPVQKLDLVFLAYGPPTVSRKDGP